jgi:hypothetical protein
MALVNAFNQNPIIIATDTTVAGNTNWRGSSGGSAFVGGLGIRPVKIHLVPNGTTVAGNVVINQITSFGSPKTADIVLAQFGVGAGAATTQEFDLAQIGSGEWKDFIVTGVTATVTALVIWYRV